MKEGVDGSNYLNSKEKSFEPDGAMTRWPETGDGAICLREQEKTVRNLDIQKLQPSDVNVSDGAVKKAYGSTPLELTDEEKREASLAVEEMINGNKLLLPSMTTGHIIATRYPNSTRNFSTITRIVKLESSKELFAIYNYPSSRVHRTLDGLFKKWSGLPMRKASYADWEETFRQRSQIPVLDIGKGKNVVVLERIPNINLEDLIRNLGELKNQEELDGCDFVKEMDDKDLLGIVADVATEIANLHNSGITWGDLVPPNIIIDKDKKIHICDPETEYKKGVPICRQRAVDILEAMISFSAAMHSAHNTDYESTIVNFLNSYVETADDYQETLESLKNIKSLSKLNFFGLGYLESHLGLENGAEYYKIREKISQVLV